MSDAAALARDTHKFESRYLDWLIGPYPQEEALYRERSPLFHADGLSKPVIFFQGEEDAVVPPNQAEVMVEASGARAMRSRTSSLPASSTASARPPPSSAASMRSSISTPPRCFGRLEFLSQLLGRVSDDLALARSSA